MAIVDRLSLQLFSARAIPVLEDQFALLSKLGYRCVEPYGALFAEADQLETLLKRYDMAAPSAHIGLDRVLGDTEATALTAKRLGIELVVVPYIKPEERPTDAAGWDALGAKLEVAGDVFKKHGLGFAWHNHEFELEALSDGSFPMERLLKAAPSMGWEIDLGWVTRASQDPIAWLNRWKDRILAVHLKDVASPGEATDEGGWADVGHGTLDWQQLVAAAKATSAKYFVVEHDNPNDIERFARRARETVASW
ncbi:sugar phosphate isomerase/epimerase family protein [Lacibacterium aquatile]|uniref:Sugar phosphate isomerase/epimerase family protein n=1 Tax=Lacibacterium aquatile TaxID=1168082 RepID=A0ABW5DTP1_9PROT